MEEFNTRIDALRHPRSQRLLQNLISNGIKYCRAGAPEIQISVDRQEGEFRFSVRDSGIATIRFHLRMDMAVCQ